MQPVLLLLLARATAAAVPADVLGASHWAPCYFLNASLPSLLDGAVALATTGSRAIKVSFDGGFPWNSPLWPASGFPDLVSIAKHPYYALLQLPGHRLQHLCAGGLLAGPRRGQLLRRIHAPERGHGQAAVC